MLFLIYCLCTFSVCALTRALLSRHRRQRAKRRAAADAALAFTVSRRVWATRREHDYTCGGCLRRAVGLDYCLPPNWSAGFAQAIKHIGDLRVNGVALKYACSPACAKKISWEATP